MLRTFLLVALLKVFPAADNTTESLLFIKKIFTEFQPKFTYEAFFMDLPWFQVVYFMIGILLLLIAEAVQTRGHVREQLGKMLFIKRWAIYAALILMIIFMGAFNTAIPGGFEYAQF